MVAVVSPGNCRPEMLSPPTTVGYSAIPDESDGLELGEAVFKVVEHALQVRDVAPASDDAEMHRSGTAEHGHVQSLSLERNGDGIDAFHARTVPVERVWGSWNVRDDQVEQRRDRAAGNGHRGKR